MSTYGQRRVLVTQLIADGLPADPPEPEEVIQVTDNEGYEFQLQAGPVGGNSLVLTVPCDLLAYDSEAKAWGYLEHGIPSAQDETLGPGEFARVVIPTGARAISAVRLAYTAIASVGAPVLAYWRRS